MFFGMTTEQRHHEWLASVLNENQPVQRIEWLDGDASLRRYARVHTTEGTSILVDMLQADENMDAVIRIGSHLRAQAIYTPKIQAHDHEQRLILLEDFGNTILHDCALQPEGPQLYQQALRTLVHLQQTRLDLPLYDRALLLEEINLFPQWFIGDMLGETVPDALINETIPLVLNTVLEQPQVTVHRDYHSRNLMVLADGSLGVLDFQDAVIGPLAYDLASLLRDVYCDWPQAQRNAWMHQYQKIATSAGIAGADSEDMPRWLDFTGLQRLLKILGLFCRLDHRDGKPGYLSSLPLVLNHAIDSCTGWPELDDLQHYLTSLQTPLQAALRGTDQ